MSLEPPAEPSVPDLAPRVGAVGAALAEAFGAVVAGIAAGPEGPQQLARALALDKVLASRLLKALRQRDPLAVVHHVPGPEPLRRVLRAARRVGVEPATVAAAEAAVVDFDLLIRRDAGDRSALSAILSSWLPEARSEFELRRKQSAFKAMSELKGVACDHDLAVVLLAPSARDERLDVVWIQGLFGLRRLRPGAVVKFATRRMGQEDGARRPTSLDGTPVGGLGPTALDAFCSAPPVRAEARRFGEVVHYVLAGEDFGRHSAVDHLTVEVGREELPRWTPPDSEREAYVFAEVSVPSKVLTFDVYVHEDVYPGAEPRLVLYDTAFGGVVDVNDRSRDLDRLQVEERVQLLGRGLSGTSGSPFAAYRELLTRVHRELGWDPGCFRGYRCEIDHPLYGCQVTLAFPAGAPPESAAQAP